jgi:hypothetical protein
MTAAEAAPRASERGPFSPLTVALMVGVAAVAFGLMLVLTAYAPDLRSGRDGRAHSLSRSAVGYAGIVQVLKETGLPLEVSRTMEGREGRISLEVFTPEYRAAVSITRAGEEEGPMSGADLGGEKLIPSIYSGVVLIVLPKWVAARDTTGGDRVQRIGLYDADSYADDLKDLPGTPVLARRKGEGPVRLRGVSAPFLNRRFDVGRVEGLQTLSGQGVFPLIVDGEGRAVLAQLERAKGEEGESEVYVLSDPDLLNNLGLKTSPERVIFADTVIRGVRRGTGPVAFDVTVNGFEAGGRSLLRLAFQPPFLAATLCALAAALLAGWQAAIRFGPVRHAERALAFGKGALADNAAGLIRLAGREHRFGGRYAALVRDQVAEAAGVGRDLPPEAKAKALDRLAKGGDDRFSTLAEAAERARDRDGLLAAARRLHRWRLEMTRGA